MTREYKDSDIEWIGRIPREWNLQRVNTFLTEINEKNSPLKTDFVLSLTNKEGVIPYSEKGDVGNKAKENYEEYKVAYPETIILNCMNILIGSVGISNYYGCVSPVYYVYKNKQNADLRYLYYVFSTTSFQGWLRTFANGILEIRLRVSSDTILKQFVPTPSFQEQQRIADFLGKKCSEIDSLIALQEQMIAQLTDYKQSIITDAVTKGLNPNAKMKDSGVEWIGEIPEDWRIIRKLSYICKKGISYGIIKLYDPDEKNGVKVLRCSDVRSGYIDETNIRTVTKELSEEYKRTILNGGEVVINVRGTLGGCAIVPNHMKGYNIAREVAVIDTEGVNSRFLMYFFLSTCFQNYQQKSLAGCVYVGLNIEMLSSCSIQCPPNAEQHAIASYLDTKCSEIDSLIALKRKKIETLKEYKKSVIYEAVTGKTIIE